MDTAAFGLLAFFFVGYFVLAGFDIGVGMMLPFLGRDRRLTIAAIAPFFLANEVWLVGAIGLMSGLYPELEARVFGQVWGALVILIAGWMIRDTGLWLRARRDGAGWRRLCDGGIVAGSWAVAASWGLAIGTLMHDGSLVGVAGPLFAITTCSLFALYGAVFAGARLTGEQRRSALATARRALTVAVLAGVPCAIGAGTKHLATTAAVALGLLAALGAVWLALGRGREVTALGPAALALVVPPLLAGLSLPGANPAAGASLVVGAIVPMLPLLIAAQAWVWWTFRARVDRPSYL